MMIGVVAVGDIGSLGLLLSPRVQCRQHLLSFGLMENQMVSSWVFSDIE